MMSKDERAVECAATAIVTGHVMPAAMAGFRRVSEYRLNHSRRQLETLGETLKVKERRLVEGRQR